MLLRELSTLIKGKVDLYIQIHQFLKVKYTVYRLYVALYRRKISYRYRVPTDKRLAESCKVLNLHCSDIFSANFHSPYIHQQLCLILFTLINQKAMINYFCIYFDATAVFILALSVNNKNKKTPVKLVIRRCVTWVKRTKWISNSGLK